MGRKKSHPGTQRKISNDSKEKTSQNGSVKGGPESSKKAQNSGISFFLLAFIVIAISSVAVTYLTDDIFGLFTGNPSSPRKAPSQKQTDSANNVVIESSQSLEDVNEKLRDKLETSEPKSTSFQNNAQTVDKDIKVETQTLSKDDKNSQVIEDTRTNSENSDSKTKDKGDDSSQVKEGKKEDKTLADGENVESKKEKQKAKRKEYAKYSITNNADYKIRKKLDEADKLLDENKLQESMRKFDEILKSHPESPRALWGRGLVYDKQAEQQRSNELLEEGIALMDKAFRLPKVPDELLMTIGTKLADRQQFRGWSAKAASTWKYMVQRFPNNYDLQRQWGVSYLLLGQNEKAREVFQQLLEKKPDDGFALVHLGFIVKVIDNNAQDGVQLLQAGIDSNEPGTSEGKFYFHLGDGYCRLNQTDKAVKVYKLGAERGLFLSEHQRSLYNVDSLTGRPWWKIEQTPYQTHLKLLEQNWETIREEGLAQMNHKTGSFLPEEENLRETGDWKQFTLYSRGLVMSNGDPLDGVYQEYEDGIEKSIPRITDGYHKAYQVMTNGRKHEENCQKTPQTCALIDQIPDARGCRRGQVKFSVMHPGVHVWPHCGPTNCRIRAHLGLVVPEGPRIRVVNDTRTWKEGKFIIFDDSFEHEVWHDGKDFRLVLIVDFWHPELNSQQKRSLSPI